VRANRHSFFVAKLAHSPGMSNDTCGFGNLLCGYYLAHVGYEEFTDFLFAAVFLSHFSALAKNETAGPQDRAVFDIAILSKRANLAN
jgi:hypothetical protein